MSIEVDWHEIGRINRQLAHMCGELKKASDGVGKLQPIAESHFANVDTSHAAGSAATNAQAQVVKGMRQAEQILQQFTASLMTAVEQHRKNDEAAQQTFTKQNSEMN